MKCKGFLLGLSLMVLIPFAVLGKDQPRTVYMSFILHGNMNYDRYVIASSKSTS